jgi:hypothetical protein
MTEVTIAIVTDSDKQVDALNLSAMYNKLRDPQGKYAWPDDRIICAIEDYRKFRVISRHHVTFVGIRRGGALAPFSEAPVQSGRA